MSDVREGDSPLDTGIEPAANETSDWLNTQRQWAESLYNTGNITIRDEEAKATLNVTNLVSPEWYNKHVRGREELVGWGAKDPYMGQRDTPFAQRNNIIKGPGANQNYQAPPTYSSLLRMPDVDPEVMGVIYDHISAHWDALPMEDPMISWMYAQNPMLLFADAEIAGSLADTQQILGGVDSLFDIATETARFYLGQFRSPFSYEDIGDELRKTDTIDYFFSDYSQYFNRTEMDMLTTGFAASSIDHSSNLAALSWHYWNAEDNPRDPSNSDDRAEFLSWFYTMAEQSSDNTKFEDGWFGKVFDDVDDMLHGEWMRNWLRRRVLPTLAGEEVPDDFENSSIARIGDPSLRNLESNFQYAGKIEDPKSYAMRSNLTIGQQLAAYVTGADVDSTSFSLISGTIDGISQIITPGEMVAAAVSGGTTTASKVARVGATNLSRLGRARLAARVALPIVGKHVTIDGVKQVGLPTGLSRRIGWALASKSVDEFLDIASENGVLRQMHEAIKNRGWGYATRNFPNLERVAADEQLSTMLASAETEEEFEWLFRMVAKGVMDEGHAQKLKDIDDVMAVLRSSMDEMEIKMGEADVLPADALIFFAQKGRKGYRVARATTGVGGRIDEALTAGLDPQAIDELGEEGIEIIRVINVDQPKILTTDQAAQAVDDNLERSDLAALLAGRIDEAPSELPPQTIKFESPDGDVLGVGDARFQQDVEGAVTNVEGYASRQRALQEAREAGADKEALERIDAGLEDASNVPSRAVRIEASGIYGESNTATRSVDPWLIEFEDGRWGAKQSINKQDLVMFDNQEDALRYIAVELRNRQLMQQHDLPTRHLKDILEEGVDEGATFTSVIREAYERAGLGSEAEPFLSALAKAEEAFPNLAVLVGSIPDSFWSGSGIQRAIKNFMWSTSKKLDEATEDTSTMKALLGDMFEWEKLNGTEGWRVPKDHVFKFSAWAEEAGYSRPRRVAAKSNPHGIWKAEDGSQAGIRGAVGSAKKLADEGGTIMIDDPQVYIDYLRHLSQTNYEEFQKLMNNTRFTRKNMKAEDAMLLDPLFQSDVIKRVADTDVSGFYDLARRDMQRIPFIRSLQRVSDIPMGASDAALKHRSSDNMLANLYLAARNSGVAEDEFWQTFVTGLIGDMDNIKKLGLKARGLSSRASLPVYRRTDDPDAVRNMVSVAMTPFLPPGQYGDAEAILRANILQSDVIADTGSFWVVLNRLLDDTVDMSNRRMIMGPVGRNELLVKGEALAAGDKRAKGLPDAIIEDTSDPKRLIEMYREGRLSTRQRKIVDEILSRSGVHGLRNEDGTVAFTTRGIESSVDVDVNDTARSVVEVTDVDSNSVQAQLGQMQAYKRRLTYEGQTQVLVYDMPPLKPIKLSDAEPGLLYSTFGARMPLLSNNRYNTIGKLRRQINARVFKTAMPETIDVFDAAGGAADFRRSMRALGVSPEYMDKYMDEWYRVKPEARESLIRRMFREEGERTGNKLLQYGIDQIMNDAKLRHTTRGPSGRDLGEVKGGAIQAPSPSFDSHKVSLPDDSLFTMMGRYRKSGRLPDLATKGWSGNGKYRASKAYTRRTENAAKFRANMGITEDMMSDDEVSRIMYSMMTDSVDGTGAVHRALVKYPVGAWRWLHKNFTRTVLSLQPIRWAQKVVFFEEQVRAALMGMPNMFTNPYRYMLEFTHAKQIASGVAWRADNAKFLDTVTGVFADIDPDNIDELTAAATRILNISDTKLRQLMELERYQGLDITNATRKIIKDKLQETQELVDVDLGPMTISRAVRRSMRKEAKLATKNVEAGLPEEFSWDMIDDIQGRSLFAEYGDMFESMGPLAYHANLDPANRQRFVRAWVSEIKRIQNDPAMRLGLHAQIGDGARMEAVRSVKASSWYHRYRLTWREIAEHQYGVDLAIASEDEIINVMLDHFGGHAENILKPFLSANMYESDDAYRIDRINAILNGEKFTYTHGGVRDKGRNLKINLADDEALIREKMNSFLAANKGDEAFANNSMPKSVETAFRETHIPRAVFEGGNKIKKGQNWILRRFGEDVTQVVNRRPAWVAEYKHQRAVLDQLGIPEEIADDVAKARASEQINWVYFNNEHMTPIVRKLNGVIPFFGASVEVATTWAHKIPFAESWAYGPLQLVKKVDRVIDGVRAMGLLNVEMPEGDEYFGNQNARYQLQLWKEADGKISSPLGELVSELGYKFAAIPASTMQAIFSVRNWLAEDNIFHEDDIAALKPDLFEFDMGNPLDWGVQNSGLGAVNQLIITPSPAIKGVIRAISNAIGPVSDNKQFAGQGTLKDAALTYGFDEQDFLRENEKVLKEEWGESKYRAVMNGEEWNVKLPGVPLDVPGTSFYDEMIAPLMYPFGSPDSEIQTYVEYIPSTWRYVARGLAIGHGATDVDFWSVNSDGELDFNSPFMESLMMPTRNDKAAVASSIITAIQQIEAESGRLSDVVQIAQELEELVSEALYHEVAYEDEQGRLVFHQGALGNYEVRFQSLSTKLETEQRDLITRAFRRASGQNLTRGMMGMTSPVTPRLLMEEQLGIEAYWDARDAAENVFQLRDSDSGVLLPDNINFPEGGVNRVAEFNDLLATWLSDPSGDAVRGELRKHLPELWAYTFGKSYWGEVGAPIETQTLDEYMDAVERGDRDPYLPEVWIQRVMRGSIETEKEVAITEVFGNEAIKSAAEIINNWSAYSSIVDEARLERSGLDYWDDLHGGHFLEWRDRNRSESATLVSEARRRFDDSLDFLDQLDDLLPKFYSDDPAEQAEATNTLSQISFNFKNLYDASSEDRDPALLNPREQALNWYFRTHVTAYYDEVAALGVQLDGATSDEEVARVFDQIRSVQDRYTGSVIMHPAGVAFPNVMDWRWESKDEQEQEQQLISWVTDKPVEFLSLDQISRLQQQVPALAPYLPQNSAQYNLWVDYGRARQHINSLEEIDGSAEGPLLSTTEARKARDELEALARNRLLNAGLSEQVAFLDLYPIERLAIAGMAPPRIQEMAGMAGAIRLQLEATGHTPGQNEIKRAIIDPLYMEHLAFMEIDPAYAQFFDMVLGAAIYDEVDRRKVFDNFVFGIYSRY